MSVPGRSGKTVGSGEGDLSRAGEPGRDLSPPRPAANDPGGGPPFIPFWMRQKLVHNEQAKLTATALNNVSVAFFVTGILTPLVTYLQNPTKITTPESFLIGVGWLLTGIIIHQIGRVILTGLEP